MAGDRHRREEDSVPDVTPDGLTRLFAAVARLQELDPDPERRFDFLGPRPDLSSESDEVLAYTNVMIDGPPAAALNVLTALCDNAPSDDVLCFLGVQMVEPRVSYDAEGHFARRLPVPGLI